MERTYPTCFPSIKRPSLEDLAPAKANELSKDTPTFWELASPHKQKVYNFICRSLSFSEAADDVFQDTFLRGMKYFGSYKKDMDFGTWLFTIAHNEIKRHIKSSRANNPLPLWEGLIASEDRVRHDLVREVYRFADGLSSKHKEVFFLFYDRGFSIKEISGITDLREGNVKFILNRARRALRELLGEDHGKPRSIR